MPESALSLLPPFLAIVIAVWRKNALLALFCGVLFCFLLLTNWHPIAASWQTITGIASVFSSLGNVYIITFSLLIGALVTLMNESGAVQGFINQLARLNWVKNERQAAMLPTVIGTGIFTDTNLSMFSGGMASQKLFDEYKLSRARLAYLLDSTCSPVSILVLINGWGAYILGLLKGYDFNNPVAILLGTIGFNFYAIFALVLAYYTAWSGKVFGAMKQSEANNLLDSSNQHEEKHISALYMWLPMLSLMLITFVCLYITGNGDIRQGSGAFSVFIAVCAALAILMMMLISQQVLSVKKILVLAVKGIRQMLPAVSILVLSFAFGSAIKLLGTGTYVSQLLGVDFPIMLIAPILFITGAVIAFATGTSWGTFAILIPIAVPLATTTGLPAEFLIAAVLSGGIFGDHASPISDTTVVASIASGCDHFEHVKTQLPYALFAAAVSTLIFAGVSLLLV